MMWEVQLPRPTLFFMAAFSQDPAALEWGRQTAEQAWGPIALESAVFDFEYTTYYENSMGDALKKTFWAFERLRPLQELVECKLESNGWEAEYVNLSNGNFPRPLNLDPGYLTEAKLVLATTKDRDHRLYLRDGIFAEVTLSYRRGKWLSHPWTYPDYQSQDFHQFFFECRNYLRTRHRTEHSSNG